FPSSSRMFRDLIPRLSDAYHLIAPDYPAFGHSAAPDRCAFGYTFDHLAGAVDGLLDQSADVMRPALATIEPGDHVAAAAYRMKPAGGTALVVVDDDRPKQPIGIITEADIVQAVADGKDVNEVGVRALITTHPTVVKATTSIREAARSMVTGHFRHLPVVG